MVQKSNNGWSIPILASVKLLCWTKAYGSTKLNFAQILLHIKTLKSFEYQKAEESKRKYYVKEPIGLDTQFLTFHQSTYQNKGLKKNDSDGLNFRLRLWCNYDSFVQASNIQSKSFAIYNSLLLEAREIWGRRSSWQIYESYCLSKLCLKCTNSYNVQERLWCSNLRLQRKFIVRTQNWELRR